MRRFYTLSWTCLSVDGDCGVNSAGKPCTEAVPSLSWQLDVEAPLNSLGKKCRSGPFSVSDFTDFKTNRVEASIPHQLYSYPQLCMCGVSSATSTIGFPTNSPQSSPSFLRPWHDMIRTTLVPGCGPLIHHGLFTQFICQFSPGR